MRRLVICTVFVLGITSLGGCGGNGRRLARTVSTAHPDPHTKRALLQVARQFNDDYGSNKSAAVYDRWDARSRRIIGRAEYVRRHRECPTAPGPATVQGAVRAGPWWLVRYSISGSELTDYWSYEHDRWLFDLVRSNPQAVRLYRLSTRKYFAAVGCGAH